LTAKSVESFVRDFSKVKAAFRLYCKKHGGVMLKLYSETRFSQIDLLLESILGPEERNIKVFADLIKDPGWLTDITKGISTERRVEFER